MSNRKLGNQFEVELSEKLFGYGFWVHILTQNTAGQPADIIAVRKGKAYLIDAKVCSSNKFELRRVEENQNLSMELWSECGNTQGLFALKTDNGIYMVRSNVIQEYSHVQSFLSETDIATLGTPLEKWVMKC